MKKTKSEIELQIGIGKIKSSTVQDNINKQIVKIDNVTPEIIKKMKSLGFTHHTGHETIEIFIEV